MNPASAFGTFFRHHKWTPAFPFFHNAYHFRNHFARTLNQHGIADLQSQPRDFIHVVQCRTAHRHAAHLYRLQHRHGSQSTGASDLHDDVVDDSRFLSRRPFIRNRPARSFRRKSQFVLHRKFVNFNHDAVNFIRQFFALRIPPFAIFQNTIQRRTNLPLRANFESKFRQRLKRLRMPFDRFSAARRRLRK